MAYGNRGIHTHTEWLGLVQPVGLVVAPAVLTKLELFPETDTGYLSSRQRQLAGLLEEVDGPDGNPLLVVPSFELLAQELLDWGTSDLQTASELSANPERPLPQVVLEEYGETLRPTHGVPKFEGEGLQLRKREVSGEAVYLLVPEAAGTYRVKRLTKSSSSM